MSYKSRSSAPETLSKSSPATPRVSKLRGLSKPEPESPSPVLKSRLSIDRSPRPAATKPAADRQSPKVSTPDKPPSRVARGSELQAQLIAVQEELKKANEQIALIDKEKAKAMEELREVHKVADEANEKLKEAQLAQKRAQEDSEIEKFRAIESQQASIEAAKKKEEEREKELESVKSQHALDLSTLLSTTQELERVEQELAMTSDAKNQALTHAEEATRIAEIHAEKAEILLIELTQLKSSFDAKFEAQGTENEKLVSKLKFEMESLKKELEIERCSEEIIMEKEASIEQLNVELEAVKMAESYAQSIVDEWKAKVEELERKVLDADKLEKSASESLESVMKQLEENNDLLQNTEAEIDVHKEKISLLEMTIGRQNADLQESERKVELAKLETAKMEKMVESVKIELEQVKEEKTQALDNEKLAASSVQTLLEEKNRLIDELENSKREEEKSKLAMESLASALHEISAEAREAKEKLTSSRAECDNYEEEIEDLKLVSKATKEKYEAMLDDAKHELDVLTSTIELSKKEFQSSKGIWDEKEVNLGNSVEKLKDENSSLEKEIDRLLHLLKQTEEEACLAKMEETQLKDKLKEAKSEVASLQEALGVTVAESMKLKENLSGKDDELQSLIRENEDLKTREATSFKKAEDFEETRAKNRTLENGEIEDREKDFDMFENGREREEIPLHENEESRMKNLETNDESVQNTNSNTIESDKNRKDDDSEEIEYKVWESYKIEKKGASPGREPEQDSIEEEEEEEGDNSKEEDGDSSDQMNRTSSTETIEDGGISPSKHEQPIKQKKKTKPLLGKFGSLLKKKSSGIPK